MRRRPTNIVSPGGEVASWPVVAVACRVRDTELPLATHVAVAANLTQFSSKEHAPAKVARSR